MSLTINLNTAALTAHRMLANTDDELGKTIERLSSGYKINTAADDPAGLVISEKLRAQVSGLGQAIKNAGDAVNMTKTAEGALSEVSSLLQTMRDLAVHAANTGGNDVASRQADQEQIANAIASINNIANETQFGKQALLNGAAGVNVSVIGNQVTGANLGNGVKLADTDSLAITVTQKALQASVTTSQLAGGGGTDGTNISADMSATINGTTFSFTAAADTATTIVNTINQQTATTGVTASLSTHNDGTVVLSSVAYGSDQRVEVTNASAAFVAGGSAAGNGQDVQATVQSSQLHADISDATWQSGKGCTLMDSLGNKIALTTAGACNLGPLSTQVNTTNGSLTFQVGAYAGQTRQVSIGSVKTDNLGLGVVNGKSLSDIDVTVDAQSAMNVLDQAITDVSTLRAKLGAMQTNVLQSSINSLTVAQENIQASESSIRDTDMAADMINLTKQQILEQAGTAMLAQANQTPQTLLKLLQ